MSRRLCAVALCAALMDCGAARAAPADGIPQVRAVSARDSLLVVAPHPDDESLCCGGFIEAARRAGARVAIVWITNGDAFKWDAIVVEKKLRPRAGAYHELARQRIGEARAAAAILNVPQESLFFLSYPDRGVLPLLLDYYFPGTPWRSKFTGDDAVTYQNAVTPGAAYDGADLQRDFLSVMDHVKPTLVLAPSPQDTHPDHRGAGLLVMRVMAVRKQLDKVRFWIVHGGRGWPAPRGYHPLLPQTVAPRGAGMQWEQFGLDAAALDTKLRAVEAHRTQTKVMNHVMLSHVRALELYSRTPAPIFDPRCLRAEPCEFEAGAIIEKSGL